MRFSVRSQPWRAVPLGRCHKRQARQKPGQGHTRRPQVCLLWLSRYKKELSSLPGSPIRNIHNNFFFNLWMVFQVYFLKKTKTVESKPSRAVISVLLPQVYRRQPPQPWRPPGQEHTPQQVRRQGRSPALPVCLLRYWMEIKNVEWIILNFFFAQSYSYCRFHEYLSLLLLDDSDACAFHRAD